MKEEFYSGDKFSLWERKVENMGVDCAVELGVTSVTEGSCAWHTGRVGVYGGWLFAVVGCKLVFDEVEVRGIEGVMRDRA